VELVEPTLQVGESVGEHRVEQVLPSREGGGQRLLAQADRPVAFLRAGISGETDVRYATTVAHPARVGLNEWPEAPV
jgi:hypothetical protein